MRRILILALVLAAAQPALAAICAHDAAPAASLLFPFVVFDYEQPFGGETTVIAVTNLSHQAQLVQVGIWTDFGVPMMEFHVVLGGYDVQRFNIRDILVGGTLPVTVAEAAGEFQGVLPDGPVSPGNAAREASWIEDALHPPVATEGIGQRCTIDHQGYPGKYTVPIPVGVLRLLEMWLKMSKEAQYLNTSECAPPYDTTFEPEGEYWYQRRQDSTATWMYVTVDVVESCDVVRPNQAAYWTPGSEGGEARYDNVLTGDLFWISADNSTAMPAVHLEADRDLAAVATNNAASGQPVSFYGRLSNPLIDGSDYREPLPTAWALRYLGANNPNMDTRILLWKQTTNRVQPHDIELITDDEHQLDIDGVTVSNCNAYTVYTWDEDANVYHQGPPGVGPCTSFDPELAGVCANLLPLVTQEVSVNEFFPVEDDGWMLFVWPDSNYGGLEDAPAAPDYYQTWMAIRQTAWGTHADYLQGTPVANANCYADQVLPGLGVDYDYVDEGGYR